MIEESEEKYMLAIKMTGTYTETADTRKFYLITDSEEGELSRMAVGMLVYSWKDDKRLKYYEKDGATYWELEGYYNT